MGPRPAETEDPRVEELEDDSDDEGPPALVSNQPDEVEDAEVEKGTSRGEKKNRKMIIKLGLKPVAGVERVTMKKSKNIMFVVAKPDVYHTPGSTSYIVFGEAKIEDLAARAAEEARQSSRQQGGGQRQSVPTPQPNIPRSSAPSNEEPVDESGVSSADIELVTSQSGCTRAQAVTALKDNDNDIVNAIMSLTM
jgi:nascent polypeptide-associated complex subunit alpha